MSRNYRHIEQYEKALLKLKEQGLTVNAIGEKFCMITVSLPIKPELNKTFISF